MNEKEHQLIFNSVRLSDYGTYTCISVNPVGYDLGYVEVTGNNTALHILLSFFLLILFD